MINQYFRAVFLGILLIYSSWAKFHDNQDWMGLDFLFWGALVLLILQIIVGLVFIKYPEN